jgi:hypothetical protein
MDVENDSLTMKAYDSDKARWLTETTRRNTDLFYRRWQPSEDKDYLWLHRTRIWERETVGETLLRARQRARRRYLAARRQWLNAARIVQFLGGVRRRIRI